MNSYTLPKYRRIISRYIDLDIIRWVITNALIILTALLLVHRTPPVTPAHGAPQCTVIKSIPTQTSALTVRQQVEQLPYGNLVYATWGHESTWGEFDGCRGRGVNGFGYGWDGSHYPCYGSVMGVARHVSHWFEVNMQGHTVRQALCLYQSGKVENNCPYADYTLSMEGGANK